MVKKLLLSFSILFFFLPMVRATECKKAIEINITDNGFGIGHFVSSKQDLKKTSKEFGEYFPEGFDYLAIDHKTVWYKFKIETTRSVRIELRQRDSAISQNAVGMAVYSGWDCLPNQNRLEPRLIPLNKFGEVSTNCLPKGEYLIQICASHKANDSIWVEIHTGQPPLLYDFKQTAHDFDVFNGFKSIDIETSCLSLEDSDEMNPKLSLEYLKTAWFTFKTDTNHLVFGLGLDLLGSPSLFKDTIYAILYKGDIRNGMVANISDTICFWPSINGGPFKLSHLKKCILEDHARYSIVLYFKNKVQVNFRLRILQQNNETENSAYPPVLGSEFKLGEVDLNQTKVSEGRIGCESSLSNNVCMPANPASPVVAFNKEFDLVAWRTFYIGQDGEITFDVSASNSCNPLFFNSKRAYIVYEGDISLDCNIVPIDTNHTTSSKCLKAGFYSIQVLGQSIKNYNNFTCDVSDLGNNFKVSLKLKTELTPKSSKYSNPFEPNNIGNLSNYLDNISTYTSDIDYFENKHPNDTFKITSSSSNIFRQFYLSKREILRFNRKDFGDVTHQNSGFVVIKGKISDGLDSLTIAKNIVLKFSSNGFSQRAGNVCNMLDTGWYSIIAHSDIMKMCNGGVEYHKYNLFTISRENPPCTQIPNLKVASSMGFNQAGNNKLNLNSTPNIGTEADYSKSYQAGNGCIICDTTGQAFAKEIYNVCKGIEDTLNIVTATFHHFSIDQKSDISFIKGEKILLYKGDFRLNTSGLLKSENRIHDCSENTYNQYNYYCGLESGFYTVVRFIFNEYSQNYLTFWVDEHLVPQHDFAKSAYQFPTLTPGSTIESPLDNFSCLTGALTSHPFVNNFIPQRVLSYPMENHKLQLDNFHERNLWYTFTAKGSGEIDIVVKNLSRNKQDLQSRIFVFESMSDPNIPFQNAYESGQIDTTIAQGLKQISLRNYNNNAVNRFFIKGNACENDTVLKRYFILVRYPYSSTNNSGSMLKQFFRINISMKPIYEPKKPGDYCDSPALFTISDYGIHKSSNVTINCHSSGEGFGEDGSNLACLYDGEPIQTTWVKISINNISKADLTFSVEPDLEIKSDNQKVKFRLLYGDCNSLTPGPCLSFSGSSFRLDCMPAGDYFLQVAFPRGAKGFFKVNTIANEPQYPECKPAYLFEPLANFSFIPPCKDTVVSFKNWSTSGNDIAYFWDFGNGITSNEKNPTISFRSSKEIDTFNVKLITTNIKHQKKDSVIKQLRFFKEPYSSKILLEQDSFCLGFVDLGFQKTLFPVESIFWSPTPDELLDSLNKVRYYTNGNQKRVVHLHTLYRECIFDDSIVLDKPSKFTLNLDTFICMGEVLNLDIEEKVQFNGLTKVNWYDDTKTLNKSFNDSGHYWVSFNKDKCEWTDTFKISMPSISDNITQKSNFDCYGAELELGISYKATNILWSTGEKSHKIIVDTSGIYTVEANYMHCKLQDSFIVDIPHIPNLLGFNDTIKCAGDPIILTLNNSIYKHEWFNGSTQPSITIHETGNFWVKISERECDTSFYYSIKEHPSTLNLPQDTFYCDLIPLQLDAGPEGKSFYWFPSLDTTQIATVFDFGEYSVIKVNKYNCTEYDTFILRKDCGPSLFIPNAFSPNRDGLNDVFLPVSENLVNFKMLILNRWGEEVFLTQDILVGWDGKYNNTDCSQDIYTYLIWFSFLENGVVQNGTTKGTLHLLR